MGGGLRFQIKLSCGINGGSGAWPGKIPNHRRLDICPTKNPRGVAECGKTEAPAHRCGNHPSAACARAWSHHDYHRRPVRKAVEEVSCLGVVSKMSMSASAGALSTVCTLMAWLPTRVARSLHAPIFSRCERCAEAACYHQSSSGGGAATCPTARVISRARLYPRPYLACRDPPQGHCPIITAR